MWPTTSHRPTCDNCKLQVLDIAETSPRKQAQQIELPAPYMAVDAGQLDGLEPGFLEHALYGASGEKPQMGDIEHPFIRIAPIPFKHQVFEYAPVLNIRNGGHEMPPPV